MLMLLEECWWTSRPVEGDRFFFSSSLSSIFITRTAFVWWLSSFRTHLSMDIGSSRLPSSMAQECSIRQFHSKSILKQHLQSFKSLRVVFFPNGRNEIGKGEYLRQHALLHVFNIFMAIGK